jgi:hypothetical protein
MVIRPFITWMVGIGVTRVNLPNPIISRGLAIIF